jgi:hypothetical protein
VRIYCEMIQLHRNPFYLSSRIAANLCAFVLSVKQSELPVYFVPEVNQIDKIFIG